MGRERPQVSVPERWICFDVGETLIEETRAWTAWADELGLPPLTLFAMLGALIERGQEHWELFRAVGVEDWPGLLPAVEARYGGFRSEDLYPDALPTLVALRARGYRLAVLANQPAPRMAELRALGVDVDVIAMSEELGVRKPEPAFFARALELFGRVDPAAVAYVGDRVDNDIRPARAAGMRTVWLRRGPWGRIQDDRDGLADLTVDSLEELPGRIDELWTTRPTHPRSP